MRHDFESPYQFRLLSNLTEVGFGRFNFDGMIEILLHSNVVLIWSDTSCMRLKPEDDHTNESLDKVLDDPRMVLEESLKLSADHYSPLGRSSVLGTARLARTRDGVWCFGLRLDSHRVLKEKHGAFYLRQVEGTDDPPLFKTLRESLSYTDEYVP